MSFRNRVFVLGGVFVVLLAALVIGIFSSPLAASRRASERPLFPGLQPDAVARVSVSDASNRVTLTRAAPGQGDPSAPAWTVEISGRPFPAAKERVDALLKGVVALARGSLVTEDPAKAASLGLEGNGAVQVQLLDAKGQILAQLTAGNRGVGGSGYYIRAGTSKQVWQTGSDIASYLTAELKFWEDLRILPRDLTAHAVVRISETKTGSVGSTWTLSREPDSRGIPRWSFPGSQDAVQASQADAVAGALLAVEGEDFLTADSRSAVAEPIATVTVSLNDGRDFRLSFGPKTADSRYPCSVQDGAVVYLVPQWRYQQIVVDRAALKAQTRAAAP